MSVRSVEIKNSAVAAARKRLDWPLLLGKVGVWPADRVVCQGHRRYVDHAIGLIEQQGSGTGQARRARYNSDRAG